MSSGLAAGFLLDQQWHWLRGETETTKNPSLATLVRVLDSANVSYAIIGGVAVQVHHPDPRATLDIDVAVLSSDTIPRDALTAAGLSGRQNRTSLSPASRARNGNASQYPV
jgi:hypothetical protein